MKRLLAMALTLVMVLSLAACGGDTNSNTPNSAPSDSGTPAPSETTPSDQNLPANEPATEPEPPAEPEPAEEDPLLLSFDFPNAGVGDNGTNNPPKYIVTLHGGVEVEIQPGVNSIVKLDGFGKTSNVSNRVSLDIFSSGDDVLEFQLRPSLTWKDIEAALREKLDLRDDVVFYVMNLYTGHDECAPQEFTSVMAQDDYGNMPNPDSDLVPYNPTDDVLPLTECSVASILPGQASDDTMGGNFSAKAVYEMLGEPACVQLILSDVSASRLKNVNYYWVCDGFYVRYSNRFSSDNHGGDWGILRYIVDAPDVVEYYMADVAALLAE